MPDGNKVGQRMTHYIETGGKFDKTCQEFLSNGFQLSWADKFGGQKVKVKSGRVKYTCESCGLNAWAKHNVELLCGACQQILLAEEIS